MFQLVNFHELFARLRYTPRLSNLQTGISNIRQPSAEDAFGFFGKRPEILCFIYVDAVLKQSS